MNARQYDEQERHYLISIENEARKLADAFRLNPKIGAIKVYFTEASEGIRLFDELDKFRQNIIGDK